MEVKLISRSDNWKDRMAGWGKYSVQYVCKVCETPIIDILHGTTESVNAYVKEPDNSICESCLMKGSDYHV